MGYDLPDTVDAYSRVKASYTMPFDLYPYQVETVDMLAHRPAAGYYLDVGTGKTAASTASALYKFLQGADQCVVLMPPILLQGWYRWLKRIPEISVVQYKGSPTDRKAMGLKEDFILMSYQIMKRDLAQLQDKLSGKKLVFIADEASALKNVGTQNHRSFKELVSGHDFMLLTGTPLSTPADGYAYVKLIAPNIYRNLRMFENLHVGERDFFGAVIKWNRLDLLRDNMKVNAVRILKEDVLKDLPEITYTPLYLELEPDHQRLYERLAEEQLLRLQNGSKIDATTATALYHALQQIIANYGHFSGDQDKVSAAIDMLEEVIEETGKLVVFTNYKMTNRYLTERLKKYNAAFVWGEVNDKEQRKALDRFIADPECKVIVLQVNSAGYGIDGLQDVSCDVMFLELPTVPTLFHQACARLHRVGQRKNVNVRIMVAERTCAVRLFNNLMAKDALVNSVVRNVRDLRDAIYGN